jgi:hypothetical protein
MLALCIFVWGCLSCHMNSRCIRRPLDTITRTWELLNKGYVSGAVTCRRLRPACWTVL